MPFIDKKEHRKRANGPSGYYSKWANKKGWEDYRAMKNRHARNYYARLKLDIISNYGGKCANPLCGDDRLDVLTIDHINGGGTKHRKALRLIGGNFYAWLKKNNYPEGFRLLCYNCNCVLGKFGRFPEPRS